MDRQAHIDLILDHYEHPRHYGALPDATVVQSGANEGCGDALTFYLRVGPDNRLSAISFQGEGCTVSQAGASIVAELLAGKTLTEVEETLPDAVLNVVGSEIAAARLRCVLLGLTTAQEAARAARRGLS